jgi:pimeloyl-ACP methyl ester carboxylesterase
MSQYDLDTWQHVYHSVTNISQHDIVADIEPLRIAGSGLPICEEDSQVTSARDMTRLTAGPATGLATRYLALPDGVIAYDDAGGGPLVVCIPSLGDVRAEYRLLRPQLISMGFRVVTMDLRGHGESSTGWRDYSKAAIGADILALIRHLNAGPACVIATSYAGGSAVVADVECPNLIAGLVLIGAFVRDASSGSLQKQFLNLLLSRPWGPTLWSMYFPHFYPSRKPADFGAYRSHLRENLGESGRIEALKAMLNNPNSGIEAQLDHVSAPTLVVMGAKDPDFKEPANEARWIANHTHGTPLLVNQAGHYPHVELPEQVGPEIVSFLMRTPEISNRAGSGFDPHTSLETV